MSKKRFRNKPPGAAVSDLLDPAPGSVPTPRMDRALKACGTLPRASDAVAALLALGFALEQELIAAEGEAKELKAGHVQFVSGEGANNHLGEVQKTAKELLAAVRAAWPGSGLCLAEEAALHAALERLNRYQIRLAIESRP
jgi:hypothetical protein